MWVVTSEKVLYSEVKREKLFSPPQIIKACMCLKSAVIFLTT